MFKKILLSFLVALTFLQVATTYVSAEEPATWYNQGLQEWYLKVYDVNVSKPEEIFGERYTAAQVDWILWSVLTWLPTKILKPEATACLIGAAVGQKDFVNCWNMIFSYNPDSLQMLANQAPENKRSLLQAVFSERSFSGISYVKSVARKLTPVSDVNAQGFGYTTALTPFRFMWQASRDVSYSLFVFAAIILAFMVMFRVKLSPQTAVTVQSAVPKLIFALILVTFSYAIAGFLVDLMYVVIGLISIIGARMTPGSIVNPVYVYNYLTVGAVVPADVPIAGGKALGLYGLFFLYLNVFSVTLLIVLLSLLSTTIGQVGAILTFIGLGVLIASGLWTIGLLIFFVVYILIIITIFIMMFKTWWTILKTFANVIFLTIFAPFHLLLGTFIPSMGFGQWIKSYISNLAVFVVTGFLFYLATMFCILAAAVALNTAGKGDAILGLLSRILFGNEIQPGDFGLGTTPGWPPLIINSSAPEYQALLYLMFSLVLFFQIPKTADIVKSFVSGRPWAYGTAIGEGLGFVGGIYRSGPIGAIRKEGGELAGANIARGAGTLVEKISGNSRIGGYLAGVAKRVGRRVKVD